MDNFKFDEYGTKFSKRVENSVGKGEIAGYSNFSISHSVQEKNDYHHISIILDSMVYE